MIRISALRALAAALAAAPALLFAQGAAQPSTFALDSASTAAFHYRFVGPDGNRVTSVAGVKGDPFVYYAGAASGGLWKTTDGGIHWKSIFDAQPVSSIGSVAVAPSDANVVWAGTGEPFIRSNISLGWGMFRSTDAGATWSRAGLEQSGRISRIAIDPGNPDRVFVAALGFAYGPQPERGIFRTLDGGKTWEKVLFVNDSTGGADVLMDPSNPRILYAAMWQIEIHTWGRESGGAGSGIWKSTDGGTTWKRLTGNGLPTRQVGKIQLAMSAANPQRVYAEIETGDGAPWHGRETDSGHLFRTDDAGATWQMVSPDHQMAGRTAYYDRMGVTPDNADEAYFLAAAWTRTLDGGRTMIDPPRDQVPGGDHHDIWFDPSNGNRFAVSHDGGISITNNRGKTWLRVSLPIAQIYHVTVDDRIPYWVYGNKQDGPSAAGPSNPKYGMLYGEEIGIPPGIWRTVGGGESGWATPDPADTNLVWSTGSGFGSGGGIVSLYDWTTNVAHEVEVWPALTVGWPAESLKVRFVWTMPLTISPHDHNKVYVGSQYVHVTTDRGQHWQQMSPDLTRNDKARQGISGGLTPDNIGVEYAGVVFSIAESRRQKGLIWAGTNDGLVQVTRDDGGTWTNVTGNIPGLPAWGTISSIEPSRYDAGSAYLTMDGHQMNNRDPWVYKTTDYGKTWTLITNGLAKTPLSYAHVVREDPVKRGLLYLGTEGGLYVSFDDGAHWQPFQSDLPHAPVYWLTVQERFNDLVVATYGRGLYIVDDITPLRTYAAELAAKDVHLFAPRATYRFRSVEWPFSAPDAGTSVFGETAPAGAPVTFLLKSAGKNDSATVTVADASGAVLRTLKTPAHAGLNRAWWDLHGEQTLEAKIRVSPPYAPWVTVGVDGKPAPGLQRYALLEPPGKYTLTVAHGGKSESQPLVVMKDPASGGSEADIKSQMELLRGIVADLDSAAALVNAIENVRAQLAMQRAQAPKDPKSAALTAAIDSLDAKLLAAENRVRNVRGTGRGQDANRAPVRAAERLVYLATTVGNSDYAPTESMRAVAKELHDQLYAAKAIAEALMTKDVAAFRAGVGRP
jgi:photosystem II stability/assembly factor-like uncharacterized protein